MRHLPSVLSTSLLCLLLQACDTPRPFQDNVSLTSPSVQARNIRAQCITPILGLPSSLGDLYAKALQEELLDREYLTTYSETCPPSDPLIQVAVKRTSSSSFALRWLRPQVGEQTKQATYTQTLQLPPTSRDWPKLVKRWARITADGLGYVPPQHRSIRSLFDGLPEATRVKYGLGKTSDQQQVKERLPLYIDNVDGVRGEGNTILRYALLGYLRRAGYAPQIRVVTPAAPYSIKGQITIGKPHLVDDVGMMQNLRIAWTVVDNKGEKQGAIDMNNDLPQATLNKQWRQISDAIAASSVNGIIQILNRAELARMP